MFDGKLKTWGKYPVEFVLKEDENRICSRPYPLPQINEVLLRNDFEQFVLLGYLGIANDLEWGSLYFVQHEPKSNQVCYVSDFININKQVKHKTYAMPNINE